MGDGNGNGNGDPAPTAKTGYLFLAYVCIAIAMAGAYLLAKKHDVTIGVSEGFAPFAVLYIVAQAIERLLQPISGFAFKAKEKKETKASLASARLDKNSKKAMQEQKKLQAIQADRALFFWVAATVIALLVCGALELGMIQSVADVTGKDGKEVPDLFYYLDIILTGVAIGAGTKPLHDLITSIQNSKQKSDPVAGGA